MSEQFDLAEFRKERDEQRRATGRFTPKVVDLLAAYERGERDFRDANLYGATLYGATLYGANLTRANLDGANLTRATLYGATLYGATLDGANLDGANLTRATLYGATLYGATLDGATLDGANLTRANLTRATLYGATLYGANLTRATLYGANLTRANLTRANLDGAIGIYSVFGLNLSSRQAPLIGGVEIHDGKIELFLVAGCTGHISPALLRKKVKETHGENIHAKHYMLAIDYIVGAFEIDMAAGKWDYLLELE